MDTSLSINGMVTRAYELAYFIVGDKQDAIKIATAALSKQEVASTAQDKRLYYTPRGRTSHSTSKTEGFRTKISLGETHMLQRLIYIESDPYERQEEQPDNTNELSEASMVIHFIKHLVRITIRRNSFYVALGLSRLLHNYSTAETMEIYNVVVQDPDRVKDDYYYRSRKGRLMQEMKERFGSLINTCRGQRGEERFKPQESPDRFADLVAKCLSFFTPWSTSCILAADFNPVMDEIAPLCFKRKTPDEEHEIEVNRVHTLLHPDCYKRLVKALGLDSPDQQLAIPQFNSTNNKEGGRQSPPKLEDEERALIIDSLAEQSARRKSVSAGLLRVLVDGSERARLLIEQTSHVKFDMEEGAEMIEVRANQKGRETVLAVHLLNHDQIDDEAPHSRSSIVLEGGQKLVFEFSSSDTIDKLNSAVVNVTYTETNLIRAGWLFLRRLNFKLSQAMRIKDWNGVAPLKPALAVILITICAIAILYAVRNTFHRSVNLADKQEIPEVKENNANSPGPFEAKGNDSVAPPEMSPPHDVLNDKKASTADRNARRRLTYGENNVRSNSKATLNERGTANVITRDLHRLDEATDLQDNGTRSTGARVKGAAASLIQVKKVYVQSRGDSSQQIRDMLINELQSRSVFIVTLNQEEADAALKVFVRLKPEVKRKAVEKAYGDATRPEANEEDRGSIIIQLVNASGDVIWPIAPNLQGREYIGPTRKITIKVVTDLVADSQKIKIRS
jgi:hypothetical protein